MESTVLNSSSVLIHVLFVVIHSSVDEVKTASDTQRGADSDSSIPSLSKAEGRDDSMKEDSISEELEDYTLDETMTEDEMERSFRSILPSESHRKRAKKQLDNVSVTSDEGSVSGMNSLTSVKCSSDFISE